ncbi:MAG: sodium-dependent transporter [Pseudomonadales bacterium]
MAARGEFSSKFGFILAASGSAVGLGNIWGFPTQAASNGGAAFLLVYLVLAFCLAYPALMAELIIGRHAKSNAVNALRLISTNRFSYHIGTITGFVGIITASLILSFYALVAGWMVCYFLAPIAELAGMQSVAGWLTEFGLYRNVAFILVFMVLTVAIISGGVKDGIEKWSTRLMPALLALLFLLIAYVLTLDGAKEGVKAYLLPDFSRAVDLKLIVSAMGQAFFSLSLGVGTMLIYGSYISQKENLSYLGRMVTFVDIGIAVMAGMLILPAMYVAQHNGVAIFDAAGQLISEDTLIFTVLPALFDTMGITGIFISAAFFILMSIAALTSSISMLEVPVAYAVENHQIDRKRAAHFIGLLIALISVAIAFNFEMLFGLTIRATTQMSQPLLGLMLCIFAGWIWHRNNMLQEIKAGYPEVEQSLFWKIWPSYVRYVCPVAILTVFAQVVFA